jgi:hypothetical protein
MTVLPMTMIHPESGGITSAATRTSFRVLEARGWIPATVPAADRSEPSEPSGGTQEENR